MSGGWITDRTGTRLDLTLLYRTFRSVCALRGLSMNEGAREAQVPYTALQKMSPHRSRQLAPTADNLLRMLLWMDPDCDLVQYAIEDPSHDLEEEA